ncbi:MAG: DNA primase [Desulfobacteraceae bacterium]
MARTIPEDTINQIKNTANIVEIVSDSVVLEKSGRNYKGLCPFHAEKTPSFTVSAEKQIFYCFGCHTGGNVFSFVMQHEGLSFPETVRALGLKYGIEVPDNRLSPEQKHRLSEKEKLFRVNELAMYFFQKSLRDPEIGQQAKAYLVGRGMTRKIIQGHNLGYSPHRWDGLLRHLGKKKVPAQLIAKTGLIVPRKNSSGYYDRFRDRIMFPIFDQNQKVIGFGGRVMGEGMPKYLNSPETPLYNKRRSLYGIQKAKPEIRKTGIVYLVEGYFDALALHLYGINNAVATLGTALTPEHVQLLKGLIGPSGKAILVYDSDQAGIKAAQRSIAIFEQGYLDARILVLPDGYDPDDYLKEYGPEDFHTASERALGMIPFLIESAIQRYGTSLEGKVKVVSALQHALAHVQDNIARSLYIKQLAERLDIDETAIMEKVRLSPGKGPMNNNMPTEVRQTTERTAPPDRLEQQIVAMIIRYPVMIPEIVGGNILDDFEDEKLKTIGQMIINQKESDENSVADWVSMIDDSRYRNLLAKLAIKDQRWERQGCERLLVQFESRRRRKIKKDLQRQIEAAERDNDVDLLSKLLKQKQLHAGKK